MMKTEQSKMIPIFRKIRKKMADDNRPLKYIRYAIGEIVLSCYWNIDSIAD